MTKKLKNHPVKSRGKQKQKQPEKQSVKKPPAKTVTPEKPPEKVYAIQRLINWLKNFVKFPFKERSEFRYNYDTQHPQYVFEHSNGKKKSVGVTHEQETFGIKNMPLKQNPQNGKTDNAFIRNGIVSGKNKDYSNRVLKNFHLSQEDKANVKSKIRNYKKRRKTRKKKAKKKGK